MNHNIGTDRFHVQLRRLDENIDSENPVSYLVSLFKNIQCLLESRLY
jgi:hypothetical protein